MKFIKMKFPGLVLILLISSQISFAQVERKTFPAKQADSVSISSGSNKTEKLSRKDIIKELDLTREQKIKLKGIRQDNMAKQGAIENNSQLSGSEKKMQLRALQKEQAQNIQAILTEEQKEKFKSIRQKEKKEKE